MRSDDIIDTKSLCRFFCITFVIAFCAPVFAQVQQTTAANESEEMLFADDPKEWSKPRVVVRPDFPQSELEKGAKGYVDTTVNLDVHGKVKSSFIAKSEPPSPALEKAVRDVIDLWWFRVKLDKKCVPQEATANVRVWFEVQDGKGVVSVSGKSAAVTEPFQRIPRESMLSIRNAILNQLSYPREPGINKNGSLEHEATIFAIARVDPEVGKIADPEITWFHSATRAKGSAERAFVNAVTVAVTAATFSPFKDKPFKTCMPFEFRRR